VTHTQKRKKQIFVEPKASTIRSESKIGLFISFCHLFSTELIFERTQGKKFTVSDIIQFLL